MSLNAFNEILLRAETWRHNVCLIFPLNGIDSMMLPSYIWDRTMFIDGDLGLEHLGTEPITAYTTTAAFETHNDADEIKDKKKQLRPLSGLISNAAMLNYANYMAITDSMLKDDNQILTQLALYALSSGKKDQLLEALSSMSIDIEENKQVSRYL